MNRRGFITGLTSLIAAPAIVKASSLMPVRGIIVPVAHDILTTHRYVFRTSIPQAAWRMFNEGVMFPRATLVTFDAPTKEEASEMFRGWERSTG